MSLDDSLRPIAPVDATFGFAPISEAASGKSVIYLVRSDRDVCEARNVMGRLSLRHVLHP